MTKTEVQMAAVRLAAVDAFTSTPLAGNGATVALLPGPASAAWMQALAAELQQSETAFLWQDADAWRLRWFTPSCEVPLCGHATLGATLALHHWGLLSIGQPLALHSRSGPLRVELTAAGLVSLDLPSPGLLPRPGAPWMEAVLGRPPLGQWSSALGYGVLLLPDDYPLAALDPGASAWAEGPERAWVSTRIRLPVPPMPWWRLSGANGWVRRLWRDGNRPIGLGACTLNRWTQA